MTHSLLRYVYEGKWGGGGEGGGRAGRGDMCQEQLHRATVHDSPP